MTKVFFNDNVSNVFGFVFLSWRSSVLDVNQIPYFDTLIIRTRNNAIFFKSRPKTGSNESFVASYIGHHKFLLRILELLIFPEFLRIIFELQFRIESPNLNSDVLLTSIQKSVGIKGVPVDVVNSEFVFEGEQSFHLIPLQTWLLEFKNFQYFDSPIVGSSGHHELIVR